MHDPADSAFDHWDSTKAWTADEWRTWNEAHPHPDGLNRCLPVQVARIEVDALWVMLRHDAAHALAGWVEAGGDVHALRSPVGEPWTFTLLESNSLLQWGRLPDLPWKSQDPTGKIHGLASRVFPKPSKDTYAEGEPFYLESRWRRAWGQRLLEVAARPMGLLWLPDRTESLLHRITREGGCGSPVIQTCRALDPEILDAPDAQGMTPLMHAAAWGDVPFSHWLLDQGAGTKLQEAWTPASSQRWMELMQHWNIDEVDGKWLDGYFSLRERLAGAGLPTAPHRAEEKEVVESIIDKMDGEMNGFEENHIKNLYGDAEDGWAYLEKLEGLLLATHTPGALKPPRPRRRM